MTALEFEDKWFHKWVKPKGIHHKIPIKNYIVTAALYDPPGHENNYILAIMSEDYKPGEKPEWFTLEVSPENLHMLDEDFEII